ncbi:MAG TPA: hypothetical protein VKX16_11700 [Chloroflexota bacterium]|nr:hypothetical protein [Chloroflexota bacterium]
MNENAGQTLESESQAQRRESSLGNVHGSPTWPVAAESATSAAGSPGPGLSWAAVAGRIGVDYAVLAHDGAIVFPGEFFPEAGYFLDPVTFEARYVDVGDTALAPGYFLGALTIREFHITLPTITDGAAAEHPIAPAGAGPITARFATDESAERARDELLRASLASEVQTRRSDGRVEVSVGSAGLPGRVATVLARHGGTITSVTTAPAADRGPARVTASAPQREHGDAARGGTGATGDSADAHP